MSCCLATVRVKWGKEKFEGVEVDTDEPPEVFKMQLFSLSGWLVASNVHASCHTSMFIWLQFTTGVLPERQKVMVGGVTLQNDDWGKAKAKIKEVSQHIIAYRDLGKGKTASNC